MKRKLAAAGSKLFGSIPWTQSMCLMGVLPLLGMTGLVSCAYPEKHQAGKHEVQVTAENILEDQRRKEAELREERNGPPIPPAEYKKLIAVLAHKRERAQQELAAFARFQRDQKIALAAASSPKMLITSSEIPADYRRTEWVSMRKGAGEGLRRSVGRLAPREEGDYPDRFYQRQLLEESAAQSAMALSEAMRLQAAQEEAPYAIPVPGRPGFVTMPPKLGGYIDVRGYEPGSYVMDPWTKTIIRVP